MSLIIHLVKQLDSLHLWDTQIQLKRNQYLKAEGSTDTNLYLVEEGSLRIYVIDEEEEHTIRFGYRDNFIAALDSFISEQPSPFYIQALKKTTVRVIKKSVFIKFVQNNSEMGQIWIHILEQLILQQMERERDLLTASPVERYRRVLARSPRLFQEIPHKYIASYLRMTPETLSRIKKS